MNTPTPESDTPETDAVFMETYSLNKVPVDFARTLERQRDRYRVAFTEAARQRDLANSRIASKQLDENDFVKLSKALGSAKAERDGWRRQFEEERQVSISLSAPGIYQGWLKKLVTERDEALTDRARFEQSVDSLTAQLDSLRAQREPHCERKPRTTACYCKGGNRA